MKSMAVLIVFSLAERFHLSEHDSFLCEKISLRGYPAYFSQTQAIFLASSDLKSNTMISQFLAKILPPTDNRFYIFFEEAAEVCELSAQLFYQIVHSDPKERDTCLIHTKSYKKRAVDALEGSLTLLNSSFITPIDREDIQLISTSLYKCTKSILKACGNLRSYNIDFYNDIVKNQAEILIRSTEELLNIITSFRKASSLGEVTQISRRIKEIENRGDEILASGTEELFSGKYDAIYVLKLREIYKGIENAVDRCSIISDLIMSVVLKHN